VNPAASSSTCYDVIVAGIGTMGSAALYHLARRGRRVLGLEQYSLAHERGSMHGHTRIIRLASHEHPDYVPLLRRSYELWRELEQSAGEPLVHVIGALEIGPPEGVQLPGALQACAVHDLPHEVLEPAEVRRRFPAIAPPPDTIGLLQPDGGYVRAEESVRAHARLAVEAGAELRTGEPLVDWDARDDGVAVRTAAGEYAASRLVLTPGAWAADLLRLPRQLFSVQRNVLAWFEPVRPDHLTPDRLPIFIFEDEAAIVHYGFPLLDGTGVKLGRMYYPGETVDPAAGNPEATPEEAEPLREYLTRTVPDAAGRLLDAKACLFTNTPDMNFVIDLHPEAPNVVFASACSGHGFKFAPVVGEILADLADEGATLHSIGFLSHARF
jgi:sarcosine oxidase